MYICVCVCYSWDVNRLDELPEYMKLCYLVLYNETNSIGRDILKDKNINVIPFLKKSVSIYGFYNYRFYDKILINNAFNHLKMSGEIYVKHI